LIIEAPLPKKEGPKLLLYMKVAKPGTHYSPQKHCSWLSVPLFSNFSFGIELPTSLPCYNNINCQPTTTSNIVEFQPFQTYQETRHQGKF
jgi:hypothetical protein